MAVKPAPAVLRALDILEFLADHPDERFTLTDIARRLDLPRATCQTVLLSLSGRGYVVREEPGMSYSLGPACLHLGETAALAVPILADADREARRLAWLTGLSTGIGVRASGQMSIVSAYPPQDPFGVSARTGQTMPLTAPFGAALVAWDRPPVINGWLRTDPALDAPGRDRHLRSLGIIRQRGYSIGLATTESSVLAGLYDFETRSEQAIVERRADVIRAIVRSEYLSDDLEPPGPLRVSQMSAPVFDHRGEPALVIMLLGPNHDLDADAIRALGGLLTGAAAAASRSPLPAA